MGGEGSQQTGWGVPSEWREPGSSSCFTSYCCLMVRICSSIPDLLGEKHHLVQQGCRKSHRKNLLVKPGLELDIWHSSNYNEKCLDFGDRKARGRSTTDKCPSFPLLQRWAGCTTQINACILILASSPLFLSWYCISWGSSCPTAAKPRCNSLGEAMCLEQDCSLGMEPMVSTLLTHPL